MKNRYAEFLRAQIDAQALTCAAQAKTLAALADLIEGGDIVHVDIAPDERANDTTEAPKPLAKSEVRLRSAPTPGAPGADESGPQMPVELARAHVMKMGKKFGVDT